MAARARKRKAAWKGTVARKGDGGAEAGRRPRGRGRGTAARARKRTAAWKGTAVRKQDDGHAGAEAGRPRGRRRGRRRGRGSGTTAPARKRMTARARKRDGGAEARDGGAEARRKLRPKARVLHARGEK
ncbi:hypothetical protein GUJ93_ZPchr0002g23029 [Zizania palustris]|uniref:Uncharacterized protein n=1 Tax=Zizania palustris TaxID=103762 RepID=A0A8J5SQQ6_ZIZPA|nr:hypothetical protein GUJ93_ZPchr0002g23029 [Zizania palustris]